MKTIIKGKVMENYLETNRIEIYIFDDDYKTTTECINQLKENIIKTKNLNEYPLSYFIQDKYLEDEIIQEYEDFPRIYKNELIKIDNENYIVEDVLIEKDTITYYTNKERYINKLNIEDIKAQTIKYLNEWELRTDTLNIPKKPIAPPIKSNKSFLSRIFN